MAGEWDHLIKAGNELPVGYVGITREELWNLIQIRPAYVKMLTVVEKVSLELSDKVVAGKRKETVLAQAKGFVRICQILAEHEEKHGRRRV